MRVKLFLFVCLLALSTAGAAQSIFKPKPIPVEALSLRADAAPIVKNFIRPVASVTASVSDGTQLAGGFGISFQHDGFDTPSNSWVIKYSIAALGFLGTTGSTLTGTAGLVFGIPGTNGLIQAGPGYDFTTKKTVLLTGVAFNF